MTVKELRDKLSGMDGNSNVLGGVQVTFIPVYLCWYSSNVE